MRTRMALGAVGLLGGLYGAWLLLSRQDLDQLVSAAIWLGGGVLLHDAVLAPLSLLVVAGWSRLLPAAFRAPAVVGLVVLGTVTVVAIPVLGSIGAQVHNPSLLNRDYRASWLVLVGVVALAVVGAGLVRRRSPGRNAAPEGEH